VSENTSLSSPSCIRVLSFWYMPWKLNANCTNRLSGFCLWNEPYNSKVTYHHLEVLAVGAPHQRVPLARLAQQLHQLQLLPVQIEPLLGRYLFLLLFAPVLEFRIGGLLEEGIANEGLELHRVRSHKLKFLLLHEFLFSSTNLCLFRAHVRINNFEQVLLLPRMEVDLQLSVLEPGHPGLLELLGALQVAPAHGLANFNVELPFLRQ